MHEGVQQLCATTGAPSVEKGRPEKKERANTKVSADSLEILLQYLRSRRRWRRHADAVLVGLLPGLPRRRGRDIRAKRPGAVAHGDPTAA